VRHRTRWIVLGLLGALLVAFVAVFVVPLLFREGAEPVSLADASRRFREEHPGVLESEGPLVPAEGVYGYRGRGVDKLSVLSLEQQQGPVMPATVEHHADGCWTLRIDYSDKHWQDWKYCVVDTGAALDEVAGTTWQRWDLGVSSIENLTESSCSGPVLRAAMKPGDRWRQRCELTNDQVDGATVSAGLVRYRGVVDVDVAGEAVPTYHLVRERAITGAQDGTEDTELWIAPNGLPVHVVRTITLESPSPVGDITYDETTDFRLESLRPEG
jgi:hypothetical protein